MRQALFDALLHAPWAGRPSIEDAVVLDVFAGTGAMGLEALSRGAARVVFVEQDRAALTALRTNIAACRAGDRCSVLPMDAARIPPGEAATLIFLDPPYGKGAIGVAVDRLRAVGRIAPGALLVAETGRDEPPLPVDALAERSHGAARMTVWRESGDSEVPWSHRLGLAGLPLPRV